MFPPTFDRELVSVHYHIMPSLHNMYYNSFLILLATIRGYPRKIINERIEPSTSGIERNIIIVALYIG